MGPHCSVNVWTLAQDLFDICVKCAASQPMAIFILLGFHFKGHHFLFRVDRLNSQEHDLLLRRRSILPFFTLLLAAMKGSELFCVQNKFGGLPYTHNMKSWWWSWYVLWRFAICHTSQGRLSHDQLNITLEAKKCETELISFLYCPKVSRKKQSWPILSWWLSWHKLTSQDSYIV